MTRYLLIVYFFFFIINLDNQVKAKENFFDEAKILYDKNKNQESKFLLQRNIVFNPKDAISYLYLAKIYNTEENQKEEEKNLDTTLLLEPNNEEAMYMLMEIELKKSNYSSVKKLQESFGIICKDLCEKNKIINKSLKNIEPKNDS